MRRSQGLLDYKGLGELLGPRSVETGRPRPNVRAAVLSFCDAVGAASGLSGAGGR